MVTHAIDFLHLTDRIVVMKEGRVQAFGTFEELANNPIMSEVLEISRKNMEETKAQMNDSVRQSRVITQDLSASQS